MAAKQVGIRGTRRLSRSPARGQGHPPGPVRVVHLTRAPLGAALAPVLVATELKESLVDCRLGSHQHLLKMHK